MSIFKRPGVRYGRTPEPETPYQRAAQAWDERIGSARVQAKNWRLMAFGSLALSFGLASGLVWQSARGTITPWVVQVDKLGQAQAVAPAYDYTSQTGALALNDYARTDDPFAKLGREQVSVDVSSVIRASPDSFRVAWTERHYKDGALAETQRWSAIVTVTLQVPHDPDRLRRNALGIYVTALNWSKELG